jgi:hypothetical protein
VDGFGILLIEDIGKPVHPATAEGAAQYDVEKPIVDSARESGEIRVIRQLLTVAAVTVCAVLVI